MGNLNTTSLWRTKESNGDCSSLSSLLFF